MPRRDDDFDDDDYDDRPRRPKKKKRKPAVPSWPKWVAGGVAFAGCIAVAILVAKGLGNSSKPAGGGPVAAIAPGVVAEPVAGGANVVPAPAPAPVPAGKPEPAAGGVKYVPRESEKKFTEFLKANGQDRRVTEAEVFAIMGEPTRRDAPVSGVKNGMAFTFYKAFWEVPGSGVSSQITFINGIAGGMIIGLEVGGKK